MTPFALLKVHPAGANGSTVRARNVTLSARLVGGVSALLLLSACASTSTKHADGSAGTSDTSKTWVLASTVSSTDGSNYSSRDDPLEALDPKTLQVSLPTTANFGQARFIGVASGFLWFTTKAGNDGSAGVIIEADLEGKVKGTTSIPDFDIEGVGTLTNNRVVFLATNETASIGADGSGIPETDLWVTGIDKLVPKLQIKDTDAYNPSSAGSSTSWVITAGENTWLATGNSQKSQFVRVDPTSLSPLGQIADLSGNSASDQARVYGNNVWFANGRIYGFDARTGSALHSQSPDTVSAANYFGATSLWTETCSVADTCEASTNQNVVLTEIDAATGTKKRELQVMSGFHGDGVGEQVGNRLISLQDSYGSNGSGDSELSATYFQAIDLSKASKGVIPPTGTTSGTIGAFDALILAD